MPRSPLRPLLSAILLAIACTSHAHAAGEGCAAAAWSLESDGARLSAPGIHTLPNGSGVDTLPGAFALQLSPRAEAGLPRPPERGGEGPYAGYVRLPATPEEGLLQVTLDQPVWIDVIADDTFLKPAAFTGVHDCKLARKSVRFPLTASKAPLLLQISGAAGGSVGISLSVLPKGN